MAARDDAPLGDLGAYQLIVKLAAGGMGTVFPGRTGGGLGFSRTVTVETLHPHLLDDSCNPPFTDDANGTKRYIPGCFHEDGK